MDKCRLSSSKTLLSGERKTAPLCIVDKQVDGEENNVVVYDSELFEI